MKRHFIGTVYEVNQENMHGLVLQLDEALAKVETLEKQRDWPILKTSDLTCWICGQDHSKELGTWCDRSDLEIQHDYARGEIKLLKNQRDWLIAFLIGTVMALTFVIHVITLEMPR